ncbi:hypothetical protein [Phenylobacterium sp.]|uniref:hypothetical protein n=1 Tax=Phenylobacterium sp. TaxID=1871053 RepID=UPI0012121236|nr:hypothetical protein [Phenylobacterium sp.]THD59521.1 MAG: hypothetical protein E8A49_16175 [Phenylobacterium sp.]
MAELSELGLTLARELHGRALAAETTVEADKLALAFQRVSRGVRQTFALELKIERARREIEREDARAAEAAEPEPREEVDPALAEARACTQDRKRRVRGALHRLIWDEAEGDEEEFEVLDYDLETRLGEAARRADFLDLPIETLIRQIKSDMGLVGELRLTACEAPAAFADRSADLAYDAGPPDTG